MKQTTYLRVFLTGPQELTCQSKVGQAPALW